NMGDHIGLVTSVSDGTAQIRFLRSSACAHCGACLTVGDSEMEISLPNTLDAKEGDRVAVDLSPKRVVQASLLAYAVPLVLMIAGVLLGSKIADWAGLVLGVAACGLGYLILRIVEKKSAKKKSFQPRMTRILDECE
ncbi:MAG: SoxR reducing system RseC family protein, partial [Eubacteriales bacterium]|nr:SoxR reducing system RseC family protein [Eubacteriales bacterium]